MERLLHMISVLMKKVSLYTNTFHKVTLLMHSNMGMTQLSDLMLTAVIILTSMTIGSVWQQVLLEQRQEV